MTELLENSDVASAYAELQGALSREIDVRWPTSTAGPAEAHRYALNPPGKLLRPLLVLSSAMVAGGTLDQILPAAVGFEAVHVGSLFHDDIIDKDAERRGRPAAHVTFGWEKAIIAGNSLFFQWFRALSECAERGVPADRIATAMHVQANTGVDICQGAYTELDMVGDLDRPLEDYVLMVRGKTAGLLEAACRVGAILAGADGAVVDALGRFGAHLGLAFQMHDDLLPYVSDADEGKPPVSDLRNQRPTLPLLLAYRRATQEERQAIKHALLAADDPSAALARMQSLLVTSAALSEAQAMINREITLACDAIAQVPPENTRYASILIRIARKLSPSADLAATPAAASSAD